MNNFDNLFRDYPFCNTNFLSFFLADKEPPKMSEMVLPGYNECIIQTFISQTFIISKHKTVLQPKTVEEII